ncbi:heterogeneous nuclear ribonucleoprotein Q-like [Daphnia pulicaria]|uniref:heterogeneous nuclear ribonucleoprotein Q-like n=1 Tax=Daphnia pulicaria TaxID=35523 RepID=UPI001EEC21B2|nr:heterogeneous nuclear ribonucleoprotein Q-like [Daphnia pulicaria]
MDPLSTLSRGFGYVNFTTMEAVAVSIDLLNGLIIKGTGAMQANANVPNCLYIGNIPKSKDKDDIKTEFSIVSGGISAAFAKQQLNNGTIKVFGSDIIFDWADSNEAKMHKIVDGVGSQAERKTKIYSSSKIKVLHVGNISKKQSSMERIKELFGEHGPIQLVEKFEDYAFVHYENRDDAAKAVEALHGHTVDGASLAVSFK